MGGLMDLFRLIRPLTYPQKSALEQYSAYLEKEQLAMVRKLLKQKTVSLVDSRLNISPQLMAAEPFFTLHDDTVDKKTTGFVDDMNRILKEGMYERLYTKFSKDAVEVIPRFIGMNIEGLDHVKMSAALQLFATDPVHILLLGDPGTGKTDIIRSTSELHPISSFGLGSGTSGAGLTITKKGKEISKGLLALADGGICAIDELNLMQEKDRASLYNAMEKGFVTYDKGGEHHRFEARVRIIATANPKGDSFAGWTVETLKQQLPFDPALLSRFHLVFLIRKPNLKRFVEISKKILRSQKKILGGDEEFIRGYVAHAEKIKVKIPSGFEKQIVDFVAEIKQNEKKYLIEVSPRIVIGFARLAKAAARMQLRSEVQQQDLDLVKRIVREGLKLESR